VTEHKAHPHKPVNVNYLHALEQASASLNERIAILLTKAVGTMLCAYVFALLAVVGFPGMGASPTAYVQWVSQTFIQLVMLSVIMVGQRLLGRHQELQSDQQFEMTRKMYADAETVIAQCNEIIVLLKQAGGK
jgi:hypothetical protein